MDYHTNYGTTVPCRVQPGECISLDVRIHGELLLPRRLGRVGAKRTWLTVSVFAMAIGNIYVITAIAVVGGGLFGFGMSWLPRIGALFLTEVRHQFHECNVRCAYSTWTLTGPLTERGSLGTWQYKCYFNQGPLYPTADNPQNCSGPRASVQGGITASMPGGSFVGALLSGFLSDILGRKRAIQVGAVIWCLGSILVCASQDIAMLVVGRFINGLSVGICSAQVPVYISELAPPSKRGRVVGTQQWAITWGILIMYVRLH